MKKILFLTPSRSFLLSSYLFIFLIITPLKAKASLQEKLLTPLKLNKNINTSAALYSLSDKKIIFEHHSKESLIPASTTKIFTSYSALKNLGPHFQFHTKVYGVGSLIGNQWKGDIYLVGSGDPSLVSERMYLIAQELFRKGIRKIDGQLYVDDTAFPITDPPEDGIRAYLGSVGPLNLNYNTTALYLSPSKTLNAAIEPTLELDTGYIQIQNNAKTTSSQSSSSIKLDRKTFSDYERVSIKGKIPTSNKESLHYLSIRRPSYYTGKAFQYFLKLHGITFKNEKIDKKSAPSSSQVLVDFESFPLSTIIFLMNKYSNNFIADTLTRTIALQKGDEKASIKKGLEVIQNDILSLGIQKPFSVYSASGLSRENKFSCAQLIHGMAQILEDLQIAPEWLSSFPLYGEDGTLEKWPPHKDLTNKLRAKTGSLTGVSSIVGVYQKTPTSPQYLLCLILNSSKTPLSELRDIQFEWIKTIATNSEKSD